MFLQICLLEKDTLLSEQIVYFDRVKKLNLNRKPNVQIKIEQKGTDYILHLTSEKLAKNVFLEFSDVEGSFSDNYFDLIPLQKKQIRFTPLKVNAFVNKENLNVLSVCDTY